MALIQLRIERLRSYCTIAPGPKRKKICEVSNELGTYGMGGCGFFGLRLGDKWPVISIFRAQEWFTVDNDTLGNLTYVQINGDEIQVVDKLSEQIVGAQIVEFRLCAKSLFIKFNNGMVIAIEEDSSDRANFFGTGKSRSFLPEDDIRKAVFLSPTSEIWT